jgi:hypothetical protein
MVAQRFQVSGSAGVIRDLMGMCIPVQFDGEFQAACSEIQDVSTDRHLTAELDVEQTVGTEEGP